MGGAASVNSPPVKDAMSAAPVGVVVSRGSSVQRRCEPFRISSVAGPGTGSGPWAESTTPVPMGRGAQLTEAASSSSSATQLPTTSTIESTAPTSWKVTFSGSSSWTAPSATDRRLKASSAREDARSGRSAPSIMVRMSAKVLCRCASGYLTSARSAVTPFTSTRSVARSKAMPRPPRDFVISGSGAPAATRAARVMSPAAPPTGWKWMWVRAGLLAPRLPAPGTAPLRLFHPSVGDPAHRHQGNGQADGEHDQWPGIALDGVRERRRVPLSASLTDHLRLAAGRLLQALAETDQGVPGAVPDPGGSPFRYDLGLHVLLEVPHVRAHAAPDLEHLPLYALRNLAHYLNCPFIQLMFCCRVAIVRWGLGSRLLRMLAPIPPSMPPMSKSMPLTMRAETHGDRKTLSM